MIDNPTSGSELLPVPQPPATIRDVMAVTLPKVMENLEGASMENVAMVYGTSHLSYVDTDQTLITPNTETIQALDTYIQESLTPVSRFQLGIELTREFSDTYGTWGTTETHARIEEGKPGYVSPIPEALRQKTIEFLSEGINAGDEASVTAQIEDIGKIVSGRVAAMESILTPGDLTSLVEKIAPTLEKYQANEGIQASLKKIQDDIKIAQELTKLESFEG